MANVFTTQIVEDGARNVFIKAIGVLDTSNLATTDLVDPAALNPVPTQLRLDEIAYSVADQLGLQILWDATADVIALALAGRGNINFKYHGGLQNNAGAGKTGKLQVLTTGWTSGIQNFTLDLRLVKQGV